MSVLLKKRLIKKQKIVKDEESFQSNLDNFINISKGQWHEARSYTIPQGTYSYGTPRQAILRLCGMITGCGIAQIHGISSLWEDCLEQNKLELDKITKESKATGIGCIIATLGQSYFDRESNILKLGFERICEYSNYQHGQNGEYKQRIYLLKY